MRRCSYFGAFFCIAVVAGCSWPPPLLPENLDPPPDPARTLAAELDGAQLFDEDGIVDAQWLEVRRVDSAGDAENVVGAYLSTNDASDRRLAIIIPGASSYEAGGMPAQARKTHREQGPFFRDAGYRTLTMVRRECGTAFGGGEADDTREIVDWLNRGGATALRVEKIYLYGYSTGGTAATVLNRQRPFAAVASLGGVTTPQDLWDRRDFLVWIGGLYATNTGLCQLGSTFAIYGPDGAAGWEALDVVNHIDELQSPELFVHGDLDVVFSPSNLHVLRRRYEQARAAHPEWAELEFIEQPKGTHFSPPEDPVVHQAVLEFFARY